jgi:hypothetical protein
MLDASSFYGQSHLRATNADRLWDGLWQWPPVHMKRAYSYGGAM